MEADTYQRDGGQNKRLQEERSAHHGRTARPRSLRTLNRGDRNPGIGGRSQENGKNCDALDTGGGAHAVTIGNIPNQERFQVDPYGKYRLKGLRPIVPANRTILTLVQSADDVLGATDDMNGQSLARIGQFHRRRISLSRFSRASCNGYLLRRSAAKANRSDTADVIDTMLAG